MHYSRRLLINILLLSLPPPYHTNSCCPASAATAPTTIHHVHVWCNSYRKDDGKVASVRDQDHMIKPKCKVMLALWWWFGSSHRPTVGSCGWWGHYYGGDGDFLVESWRSMVIASRSSHQEGVQCNGALCGSGKKIQAGPCAPLMTCPATEDERAFTDQSWTKDCNLILHLHLH